MDCIVLYFFVFFKEEMNHSDQLKGISRTKKQKGVKALLKYVEVEILSLMLAAFDGKINFSKSDTTFLL
jgi:hypothetical protein